MNLKRVPVLVTLVLTITIGKKEKEEKEKKEKETNLSETTVGKTTTEITKSISFSIGNGSRHFECSLHWICFFVCFRLRLMQS